MHLTRSQQLLLGSNICIILGFGWFYSRTLNYEFLAYVITIAVVTAVLFTTLRYTHFGSGIIAGITIWGLMHMLGGSIQTADGVLYAWRVVAIFDGGGDFFILKYDQIVHAFLYGVVGIMFFHLLREVVGIKTHLWFIAFVAIFASAGFSSINEIIEFSAVVALPETGVGGYHNTVLDMIFNLGGAFVAVVGYVLLKKRTAW